jgi:hypothetical protein
MARVLFLFLDGVGLDRGDPTRNPFAAADTPVIYDLLGGRRLLIESAPYEGERATLLALDACLGVPGRPQSASGQATLLTGRNIPGEIGEHYGPKPNPAITQLLEEDNIFAQVRRRDGSAALLNAYPPRYFEAIESGRRLLSAIPLAATAAGVPLRTAADLEKGQALSADFTGAGWAAQPGFPPAPVYSPTEAGALLAELASGYDLTWFDFWPSDYAGHRGSLEDAIGLLENLDIVLGGLAGAWKSSPDLVVITSDHGNIEDAHARGHTRNPVPLLLIGPLPVRARFSAMVRDLTHVAPAVARSIFGKDAEGHG